MDVPVALGLTVTFVASSGALFEPGGLFGREVYFDSLTMFVSFLLAGRYLELRARHRAAAALEQAFPGLVFNAPLDLSLPEPPRQLVAEARPVRHRWISEAELDANPGLVRSMSVQPPRGLGRVRVLEIEGVDLQPCGGTHVANTADVGDVVVTKIEKKSAMTRRVVLGFTPQEGGC